MQLLETLVLAIAFASLKELSDDSARTVVDEILAGIDANLAMIESGSATYKHSRWLYAGDVNRAPTVETVSVLFQGENLRWVGELTCARFDKETAATFQPTVPGALPYQTNIVIRERKLSDAPRYYDPRTLGHCLEESAGQCVTLADRIRASRKTDLEEIVVSREGEEVVLTFRIRPSMYHKLTHKSLQEWKLVCHVAREQGYGLTRYERWGDRNWPHSEGSASYIRANNGAFVASHFDGSESTRENGKRVPISRHVVELVNIDLYQTPSDEDFTFAAMGVPVGARIQDRIENREYLYEIAAVTEDEIQQEWRRMSREHAEAIEANQKSRRNWTIGSVLGGIVLLAAAFVGIRMYRAA